MKLLLTSAGIKNTSIQDALVDLLGKPIADSDALCIPTAGYGHPQGSPGGAWRFIAGQATTPMCELGWKSFAEGRGNEPIALAEKCKSKFIHGAGTDGPHFGDL